MPTVRTPLSPPNNSLKERPNPDHSAEYRPYSLSLRRLGLFFTVPFKWKGYKQGKGKNSVMKTIGIIKPLQKPAYYDAVVAATEKLENATVTEIDWETMAIDGKDVVIFPEPSEIPYGAGATFDRYLRQGGNLLTLGGPAMTTVLHRSAEGWKLREELTAAQGRYEGRPLIWDFEQAGDANGWSRNVFDSSSAQQITVGDFGSPDSHGALQVKTENYKGWDMLGKSVSLPSGYENFGLYAKGDENTRALAVQLTEKDGSVWIAVLGLDTEWHFVSLPNHFFHYWFDNPSKGRGGAGDHVHFEDVVSVSFGLSASHTAAPDGDHTFWLDSVFLYNDEVPEIDELAPQWKFYPINNGVKTVTFDNQCLLKKRDYSLPREMFSPSPRPQGTGFEKNRKARFIPLIEVYDDKDLRSGLLAWMLLNYMTEKDEAVNPYEDSVIAGFGTSDPNFYNENGLAALIDVIRFMLRGEMFIEAGATEYLYIEKETPHFRVGARLHGAPNDGLRVKMALLRDERELLCREYPSICKEITEELAVTEEKPNRILFSLYDGEEKIDELGHELVFWNPKPMEERRYITTANNEFIRDGKPIRMFGVSYMPCSNIAFSGAKGWYDWEHYQSLSSYDPDVCRKDLQRIKEVGFNAIALYVYYDVAMQTKNILHLLEMCDQAGLTVDFALRSYFPLEHDPSDRSITDIIKVLHLDELDYISGYDIGWEQCVGAYIGSYGSVTGGRRSLDGEWLRWVAEQYGTVEAAEAAWGEKMPMTAEGSYTCPSDEALSVDSPASNLVAAYRRFIDGFVAQKHGVFREMIRSVDPYHLISARTNYSGIPLFNPGHMAFDFQSLAPAFDYMSPEYYGNKENIYRNVFTNIYARFAKPGAPVVWKEFGYSAWTGSNFPCWSVRSQQATKQAQAEYVEEIYKTIVKGHTGAVYYWFWPAGYRPAEVTDHGVTDPDGSDRPVTTVLRHWRNEFLNQPLLSEPEVIFAINRDKHPSGICGIYRSIEKELHEAVDAGKVVAFVSDEEKN